MKPERLYLDQISPKTRNHTVRVKVLEKERPQQSARKTKYQHMTLMDDMGNKMKATLFGVDIEIYGNIIQKNKKYDITNGLVKDVDPNYSSVVNEKKLYFTNRTMIEGVHDDATSSQQGAQYVAIAAIPRTAPKDDRFDILAVVLHIDSPKVITPKRYAGTAIVREIVVTDDSYEQPIIVSAWQDLATGQCNAIADIACENPVVSLTSLQRSTHNDFSLATTKSTEIELDPQGERANTLRMWCKTNLNVIREQAMNFSKVSSSSFPLQVTTIKEALGKKGVDTTEGQLLRLKVRLFDFKQDDLRVSVGCSNCGKTQETEIGQSFMCDACNINSTSQGKIYFNFKATDGTGTIELTANTKTAEKMLQLQAKDFYEMNYEERATCAEDATLRLRTEPTELIISPVSSLLLKHGVVKWILKDVVVSG